MVKIMRVTPLWCSLRELRFSPLSAPPLPKCLFVLFLMAMMNVMIVMVVAIQ